MGYKLNISGGRAEWTSMEAAVQRVSYGLDSGSTSLGFGSPNHLSAPDLVSLLKVNRIRRTWTNKAARSTGKAGGQNTVSLPSGTANTNGVPGLRTFSELSIGSEDARLIAKHDGLRVVAGIADMILLRDGRLYIASSNGTINASTFQLPPGSIAEFRPIKVCVDNGNGSWSQLTMYVLGTGPA